MVLLALLTIFPVGYLMVRHRQQPGSIRHLAFAFGGGLVVWLALMSWPLGPHGDYLPWQVVFAGVVMVAVTAVLAWRCPHEGAPLGFTAACGFALAWGVWAGSQDETGQWGAGLIFVLIGAGASLALVGSVSGALARRLSR